MLGVKRPMTYLPAWFSIGGVVLMFVLAVGFSWLRWRQWHKREKLDLFERVAPWAYAVMFFWGLLILWAEARQPGPPFRF